MPQHPRARAAGILSFVKTADRNGCRLVVSGAEIGGLVFRPVDLPTDGVRHCHLNVREQVRGEKRKVGGSLVEPAATGNLRPWREVVSSAVIARLKGEWEDEYRQWQRRDLSARQYVYVWADGVYLQARMPSTPPQGFG
jgi:hypothetical protein